MKNKAVKGFYYYPATKEFVIGKFYPRGGTEGEFRIVWTNLYDQEVPQLIAFDDSWKVLSQCQELLAELSKYSNNNLTAEKLKTILSQLNYFDMEGIDNDKED
ncbi:hypothetical protein [Brassicibacter mesophilus]|uniref:hypothetical protein n=1 Tax=Brassicibacter mesophilus TaxID=745119 RepID=UPI003D1EFA22